MGTLTAPIFAFDNWFARDLAGLAEPWAPAGAARPSLLVLNDDLAAELGVDPATLRADDGVAVLAGNQVIDGSTPVAQAYAGHQFGGYSPRLGDGRALLLGEVIDTHGRRRDIHLKGSGRTPFARGGDGRAAVGPMLREYVIGEAMHALGIPTTRALAVIGTGEDVARETMLPGAILVRVAASHLRVGMFQYAAAANDPTVLRRLADHAIARHHPAAADTPNRYLSLYRAVLDAQADLVARWMLVGFIHGVMNTDNMTISGETIDYGPCAFMDAYDPATVFSSIDHGGRYAYGNQPAIAQWNLARLGEALLPLIDDDPDTAVALATEVLQQFPARFGVTWRAGMRAKLGLAGGAEPGSTDDDDPIVMSFLDLLRAGRVDHTSAFRSLAGVLRGDPTGAEACFADDPAAFATWRDEWQARLATDGIDPGAAATAMDAVNPCYLPRNHLVDAALADATAGDLTALQHLASVVRAPFTERPGFEAYAMPAPDEFARGFRTFCGT